MNVNMDVNNIMNQVPNNMFPVNNQVVADKNSFINMLAKMSGEPAVQSKNLNIMEILAGSSLLGPKNLTNTNDIETISEEKPELEKELKGLMELQNIYNFGSPIVINTPFQADRLMDTTNNDYFQGEVAFNFKPSEGQQTTDINNFLSKTEKSDILNVEVESDGNLKALSKESSNLNISAEKLITEIEGHRDKLKKGIDFQAEMLTTNKTLVEGQNKIINISDESTALKPQIMSQVKDTIVFMTKEGPEPGTNVRNVTMELHPVSLGKVEIKMTYENNKVTVEIKALNEETQNIIASKVDELASMLGKSSESVNIIVKSADSRYEHQLYNYHNNNDGKGNEQSLNQDEQNNGHGRHKNNYYYNEEDSNEDDDTFSQLINLRNIKLNV